MDAVNHVTGTMAILDSEMALKANEVANRKTPGLHQAEFVWQSGQTAESTIRVVPGQKAAIAITGRSVDMAMAGKNYFAVDVQGSPMASLNGQGHLNAQGRLADSNGHEYISDRQYRLDSHEFVIETGGQIRVGNTVVARLMVLPSESVQWQSATNAVYFPAGDQRPTFANTGFVQGFLNGASVDVNDNVSDILRLRNAYKMNSETIKKLYATDDIILDGMK